MGRNLLCLSIAVILSLFGMTLSANAQITVDPYGFSVWVEMEDTVETSLTIQNDYDFDVDYQIKWRKPRRDEALRVGPQRDDPGEVVNEVVLDYNYCLGLEYDPVEQIMWASHATALRICGYRWDGEEITETAFDFAVPTTIVGAAYHDGIIYTGKWDASGRIFCYDADGEALGELETGYQYIMDLTVDHERQYLFAIELNANDVNESFHMAVYDIADDYELVTVVENLLNLETVNYRLRLCWVPEHEDAPLWVSGEDFLAQQLSFDDEWNYEIVNEIDMSEITDVSSFGIAHDGENLWVSTTNVDEQNDNTVFIVDDGISELPWFTADPKEGTIGSDESAEITITTIPVEVERGAYEMICRIMLSEPQEERDDLDVEMIEMSAVMVVLAPVAQLAGVVTDPAHDDAAVEGVMVDMDYYTMPRWTDEDGAYGFANLPVGDYTFTFTAPDYLPHVEEVSVEEAGEIELNVDLLHSEFTPDMESIDAGLEPGFTSELTIHAENGGNGPLTYSVTRNVVVENPAEPWDMVNEIELEELLDDNAIQGVEFVDGYYYVCGGFNNNAAVSKIYVLDAEGELQSEFDQPGATRYGIRDLAWDGELLWGVEADSIYGITTDGERRAAFRAPRNPCRSITWDSENGLLWVADATSALYGMTRDGEIDREVDRPAIVRFYGLAYWGDDPEGYDLFAFSHHQDDDICEIYKMNVETGDFMLVKRLPDLDGREGGACITNQLDPFNWFFVGLVQSADRIAVWNLETRRDWFQIEPESGIINAGENQDFSVLLNAEDLIIETYRGELVFSHDGVGSQTVIPVTLHVEEGEVHTSRTLSVRAGWNTVSLNLQPDVENVEELLAEWVESGNLVIMKDGYGNFYSPEFNHNDIGNWSVEQGYQLKMNRPASLQIEGWSVIAAQPLVLEGGWQLVSYYPRPPSEATVAVSGIAGYLVIMKDGFGNFYAPDWDFSNIGNMEEGRGYYMNIATDDPIELIYQVGGVDEQDALPSNLKPVVLPIHPVTGENMSLLVLSADLQNGEVGVYAGDLLVGSGVLQNGRCGIAVWADDPLTEAKDGAMTGENLELRLSNGGNLNAVAYEVLAGEAVYSTNGFSVVRMLESVELPLSFGLESAYPNPFNSSTRITYNLPESGDVKLAVYDLSGRHVGSLINGHQEAGSHVLQFDASALSSGVYVVRLEGQSKTSQIKIALVK